MKKIALLSTLIIAFAAKSQNLSEDSVFIKRISNNILSSDDCYSNLWYLCKKVGGRLAGSPQMVKAENWGLATFQKYRPTNAWLQECMVPHWVRGGKDTATASYKVDGKVQTLPLHVLALGNSIGTGAKGVTAEVLTVKSFDDLEGKKDKIKGKIVFYDIPFDDTLINPFEAYGKYVVYRAIGASRAAKYGAVAVMVRSMTNSTNNNYPHTGSLRYLDSLPQIPAVAVGLYDVKALSELDAKGIKLTASIKTFGHFLPDTIGHNVLAEIKGSAYPNEYITIGGHLDSWDPAEGANDDGTGVVQTAEVLRVLKAFGYQPKHSIRFVMFANEENGTRGGAKYAEEAKAKGEKHIFALESDEGGFTPRGFGLSVSDASFEKVLQWRKLFEPYHVFEWKKGGGGSDIGALNNQLGTPTAGFVPDSQRYFDIHHAKSDVFENVNIRELQLGAVNIAALIYLIDKYGL
jgi:carboxypeptidase Q